MHNRTTLIAAFAFGFLAVAIGAFGAHGLKPYMNAYQQSILKLLRAISFIIALHYSLWRGCLQPI